ncbi:MAG: hypothetical protein AB1485_08485 [Candidatus Thermoplasmatota archaeon]
MDLESLDRYLLTCFGKRVVALFNVLYYAYEDGYLSPDLYREILLRYFCSRSQLKFTLFEDSGEIIFIYPTDELIERFLTYPQITQIIGGRRTGKTIAEYTIATKWKIKNPNGYVYVWGDRDLITWTKWETNKYLPKKVRDNWYRVTTSGFPKEVREVIYDPSRNFPILLCYDELTYETATGLHFTRASRQADMTIRQIRHLGASEMAGVWIIYLSTVYSALQKQKRIESDLTLDFYTVGSTLFERLDFIRDPQLKYVYAKLLPQLHKPMPNMPLRENYGLGCIDGYKLTLQPIIMPDWLRVRSKMSKKQRLKHSTKDHHIGKEELEEREEKTIEDRDKLTEEVKELKSKGMSVINIAKKYGVNRRTVYDWLSQ